MKYFRLAVGDKVYRMTIDDPSVDPKDFVFEEVPQPHGGTFAIDVYHRTGEIDWAKVYAQGYYLAIMKASQGDYFSDPRFVENTTAAREAGLLTQFYHFGCPHDADSSSVASIRRDAMQEVWQLRKNLLRPGGDLHVDLVQFKAYEPGPPVRCHGYLDLEKTVENLNEEQGLVWLEEFFRCADSEGIFMGLYVDEDWLEEEVTPRGWDAFERSFRKESWGTRPLFVARYGKNDGQIPDINKYPPGAKVPPGWQWSVWQYTSKGQVEGVPRRCDLSIARIDWDVHS
jgi:hypothetical protein